MKISRVEFKNGAIYDHASSQTLIRRLRAMGDELGMIASNAGSRSKWPSGGIGLLCDSASLLTEAATWISIMTDAFMEEDEER